MSPSFGKILFSSIAVLFIFMWVAGNIRRSESTLPSYSSGSGSSTNSSTTSTESTQSCDQQAVVSSVIDEIGSTVDSEAEIEIARQRIKEACGY